MGHIKDWPLHLNETEIKDGKLVVRPMFQTTEEERAFWKHVSDCDSCLPRVLNVLLLPNLPEVLIEDWAEAFIEEIGNYLSGVHPNEEVLVGAFLGCLQRLEEALDDTNESNIDAYMDQEEVEYVVSGIQTVINVECHIQMCSLCLQKLASLPGIKTIAFRTAGKFYTVMAKVEEKRVCP